MSTAAAKAALSTQAHQPTPTTTNIINGDTKSSSPSSYFDSNHTSLTPTSDIDPTSKASFDVLPIEVLSLVASLVSPPFYLPPPPAEPSSKPPAHIVESLDPKPAPQQTSSQAVSALTKCNAHVLEATRPWLWENVDVRSGRGWLAVVDALTEEVVDAVDDEQMSEVMHHDTPVFVDTPPSPRSPDQSPGGGLGFRPHPHHHMTPPDVGTSASAAAAAAAAAAQQPSQPQEMVPSVPVGTAMRDPRENLGLMRSVTINDQVSKAYYSDKGQWTHERTRTMSPPQPRRLSMLITPPGSRNTSPSARLRGRSRSPRRNLVFEEGISSVLARSFAQRSFSGSLPHGQRPLIRQSSLSLSRTAHAVLEESDDEDCDPGNHQFMQALRTPPKEPVDLPEHKAAEEEVHDNVNPDLLPPPGPYIRHLSFTNFRTIGSRRSQDEAVRGRYVTAGRLEGVIKNTPNLRSLCMTEYVDSALSAAVVEEIFFRGYAKPRWRKSRTASFSSPKARARSMSIQQQQHVEPAQSTIDDLMDPPRPSYVPYEEETEDDKWARRRQFVPLESLDLTGCVSDNFTDAIHEFGENWLGLGDEDEEEDRGRGRSRHRDDHGEHDDGDDDDDDMPEEKPHRIMFPALRRLSLRTCRRLPPAFIHALVLSMPNLTHLDLSGTRVGNSLLIALTNCPPRGMRLESLSLARCPGLDPAVVVDFLVKSPVAAELVDLNLFVNPTQGNAIGSEDMTRLLEAPCIRSGRLRYLDLSSAGITPEHLAPDAFPPQPSLVSLGMSHIPLLPLRDIAAFIQGTAPGVEVLTLAGTAVHDLRPDASSLQITLCIHALLINPLTTMPFSISGLNLSGPSRPDLTAGPTRLRVVELSSSIRRSLENSQGASRTEWQVIRSKGGRGWYVDVSAGWIPARTVQDWGYTTQDPVTVGQGIGAMSFVRHLPNAHEWRQWLTRLAEANGRVSSYVGWHSRKMEVVRGEGMMGREDGMGGVDAFALE